jgi:alkylation response protein AidB-like acyl-CoA dehydrogenase
MSAMVDEVVTDALLGQRAMAVRTQLRAILAADVAPMAAHWDQTHEFAGTSYRSIADAGLAGLLFPVELGGTGDTAVTYAMAVEEIAAVCPATSLIYMTQMHAAHPIMLSGTSEQQQRYVPGLCSGDILGSLGITEPAAGSDMAAIRTVARRDGSDYVLSGSKTFITTGDRSDITVLFATVDPSAGRRGITAFLVPGDAGGVTRGRPFTKMGMHGSTTAEIFLDAVRLPESARLGAEGSAWTLSMQSVTKSRLSAAAQGVGIARAAYIAAATVLYRDGPPEADISAQLAQMRARLLAARTLLYTTAMAIQESAEDLSSSVSSMKLLCTDTGVQIAEAACDLLGPYGDLGAYTAERCLRDAKVTQIYDGTNQIQQLIIGRDTARTFAGAQK